MCIVHIPVFWVVCSTKNSVLCYSRILTITLNLSVIGTVKAQNWELKTNAQREGMIQALVKICHFFNIKWSL
jgi:predicted acyltransferase (DUF342 family)